MKKKLNLMNLANEQLSNKEMEELNGGLRFHIGNWYVDWENWTVCSATCHRPGLGEGAAGNKHDGVVY